MKYRTLRLLASALALILCAATVSMFPGCAEPGKGDHVDPVNGSYGPVPGQSGAAGPEGAADVTASERVIAEAMFRSALPKLDKAEFIVAVKALAADADPVVLTQHEFMRRMKDMAAMQGSMGRFYGEMPDSYTLTLNAAHPLVKRILDAATGSVGEKVDASEKELSSVNDTIATIDKKKAEERTDAEKTLLEESRKRAEEIRAERDKLIADYAATQPVVSQLIDLALLGNGLLKGEALSRFLHRSVELL